MGTLVCGLVPAVEGIPQLAAIYCRAKGVTHDAAV